MMRKTLTPCVIIVLLSLMSCAPEKKNRDYNYINEGDILFRRGSSLTSRAVLLLDNEGIYSHIGIAVKVNDKMMVAHAIPSDDEHDYVKVEEINEFFKPSNAVQGCVSRMSLNQSQKIKLNNKALSIVESKIPFDHDYDTASQDKLYCTEYIWEVFKAIDKDISCGKRQFVHVRFTKSEAILPSHIFKNPHLLIVKSF